MAVTQTIQWFQGRRYCLVLDPEDDSIEVVFEEGFEAAEDELVDFAPAHFVDALPVDLPFRELRVRLGLGSDRPIGLGLERFSKQMRGKAFNRMSPLEGIGLLLGLADKVSKQEALQEPRLWPGEFERPVVRRAPDGRLLVGA